MARQAIVIKTSPDSELARGIRAALSEGAPLAVDTGEAVYALQVGRRAERGGIDQPASVNGDVEQADVDVELSQQGIRRASGSWEDIDIEAFKAYIAERRRTAGRPPVRL